MKPNHSSVAKIVSFSGIDGAGKTTQIDALTEWLRAAGLRVELLTFWDNIVVLSGLRENLSHKAFKGDKGIGSPDRPLNRRDKNVTSRPVVLLRFGLYLLDALNLRRKVFRARKSECDVVIFDRYIFDELANLPLQSLWTRSYIWLVLRLVPAPDVAYVIDADPVAARARKPEYPLEFLRKNRDAYITISKLAGGVSVIEPLSVTEAASKVKEVFLQRMSASNEELWSLSVAH